jgi:serine/threonine protein kinase
MLRSFHLGWTVIIIGPSVTGQTGDPELAQLSMRLWTGHPTMAEPTGSESPLDREFVAGESFGRYVVIELLGHGAFGSTYLARDSHLDRLFALKLLGSIDTPAALSRFMREARAAVRLDHPILCPVYDVDEVEGVKLLVRPYIEGEPLSELVRSVSELPRDRVLEIVTRLALALEFAHQRGVVHLALKPSNIIMDPRDEPMIVDFATRRNIASAIAERVNDTTLSESLQYMSPELLGGHDTAVSPASDIYSLGVILYELYAGRLPFDGLALKIVEQILTGEPPPPSTFRRDSDETLDGVCLKALARDRVDRYRSMLEMAEALRCCSSSKAAGLESTPTASPSHDSLIEILNSAKQAERGPPRPPERPLVYDEDVQFTVYRPGIVQPGVWCDLLAFAHLSRRRGDAPADEPDPLEEVQRQAQRLLGASAKDYHDVTQDSRQAIPREGEITFLPEIPGFEFNPPRRVFRWVESVHSEHFRFRASAALEGQFARGRLTVLLGAIIIAEVTLTIRVDRRRLTQPSNSVADTGADSARPYRKIFASYSHQDFEIVGQFEAFARTLGDEYLRDGINLRAGQVWNDEIRRLIRRADIFQLFWSSSAMRSPYVRQEWEYALSLARPQFIRPTYWEEPFPSSPQDDLPPEALLRLHFQRLSVSAEGSRGDISGHHWSDWPASGHRSSELTLDGTHERPPRPAKDDLIGGRETARGRWNLPRVAATVATCIVLFMGLGVLYELTRFGAPPGPRGRDQPPPPPPQHVTVTDPKLPDDTVHQVTIVEAPGASEMYREMSLAAGEIKERLGPRGERKVAVGEFRATSPRMAGSGAAIGRTVGAALVKAGVVVAESTEHEVNGEFDCVLDPETTRLALEITPWLSLRVMNESDPDRPIRIKALPFFQTRNVFDETTIAILTGVNAVLPPDAPTTVRSTALAESINHPMAIPDKTRTRAGADSPFAIEILVKSGEDYRPREAAVASGIPYMQLRGGETYAVRLINDSSNDAAVTLSVDGLDVFASSETSTYSHWIVPSRRAATVVGWHGSNEKAESFVVTDPAHSAAAKRYSGSSSIGTITATFAASWPTGGRPPADELVSDPNVQSDRSRAPSSLDEKSSVDRSRKVGKIRAAVSVRYDRPR